MRNTRKTELPAANLSLVFLWGLVARRAPFALLSNTRKTELPPASATRVFLNSLGARTAPFALLSNTLKTDLLANLGQFGVSRLFPGGCEIGGATGY
ncbi:MAG: hypothetical protein JJE04_04550 [Acidobacteriia bacterium]|nr:hypothetical protein [Terriglobia bacterium]